MGLNEDLLAAVGPGEEVLKQYKGMSAGMNASSAKNRTKAGMLVTSTGVIIGNEGAFFKRKIERFDRSDILEISEDDIPRTGLQGAVSRKNESHAMARAFGATSADPGVYLRTSRGDIAFCFKPKERGLCREAFLAIKACIS